MLSLLGFRESLFAGVLDAGESEVFLGGSRLARFMESVDAVTSPSAETEFEQTAQPEPKSKAASTRPPTPAEPASKRPQPLEAGANPWTPLLSAGLKLVEALASTPSANGAGERRKEADVAPPMDRGRRPNRPPVSEAPPA